MKKNTHTQIHRHTLRLLQEREKKMVYIAFISDLDAIKFICAIKNNYIDHIFTNFQTKSNTDLKIRQRKKKKRKHRHASYKYT